MKKVLFIFLMFLYVVETKSQYVELPTVDLYDTELMNMSLRARAQMYERIRNIMYSVQPQRQLQIVKYKNGKYDDAINICIDVYNQYVRYELDNKAICDMEALAGDCAVKLKKYELAIALYEKARNAGIDNINSKLASIFYTKMDDARKSYNNSDYRSLWNDVSIALKTGWESGECFFYQGVCYENAGNMSDRDKYDQAKKMYKQAKKKGYTPAAQALQSLKNKKKNRGKSEIYY